MNYVFLNTYLRNPEFIFQNNQHERINYIPEYTIMNKYTIIGLSEVFGSNHVKKLAKAYKKHNFTLIGAKDSSSGLAIAFNKKIYKLLSIEFETYNSAVLPDSLANKGIFYCILENIETDQKIPIIITHLQSDYAEDKKMSKRTFKKYQICQAKQLNQIKKFITDRYIEDYLLMGDFNISLNNNDPIFNHMKKLFNIRLSALPKFNTYDEDNRIIDYIINNISEQNTKKLQTYVLRNKVNDIISNSKSQTLDMLSDHFAICMVC